MALAFPPVGLESHSVHLVCICFKISYSTYMYRIQHRNFGAEVPIHRNFRYNGRIGAEPAVISSLELSQGNVAELLSNLSPEDTKTPQLTSTAAFESTLRRVTFEINRSSIRRTLLSSFGRTSSRCTFSSRLVRLRWRCTTTES